MGKPGPLFTIGTVPVGGVPLKVQWMSVVSSAWEMPPASTPVLNRPGRVAAPAEAGTERSPRNAAAAEKTVKKQDH